MLKVHNSLSGKKELFKPRHGKKVNMFVCGITPYDSAHIGNFRVFIVYDMMARYLRYAGYNVFYLQNVTDIDDKIIAAAKKQNIDWKAIVQKYYTEFRVVGKKLNITSVTRYAKATTHMREIVSQIERLVKKGYAYESNGSVYFEVKKFKDYGKLSRQNLAKLHAGARLEDDKNKRHPYDFVVWKTQKPGEPAWSSPWGKGRPGWHIEDTAITEHFFGPQYDLHGGATELKFPHHEAEIAQQESASGKRPFVKYWVHAGILNIGGEKMSKSFGNFVSGSDMVAAHEPDAFRFLILSAHYRSPIHYTEKLMAQAAANLASIRACTAALRKAAGRRSAAFPFARFAKIFAEAMDDDFNTPRALAAIFSLVRAANTAIAKKILSRTDAQKVLAFLKTVERVFGVSFATPKTKKITAAIVALANERHRLRKAGKWAEADAVRTKIAAQGYEVRDTKEGYELISR